MWRLHRHDGGFINPGHHAILRLPDEPGVARLSFSAHRYAHTYVEPAERPEHRGYSLLRADTPIARHDTLSIPYIQGVARVPPEFDAVADITFETSDSARLTSASGVSVSIACHGEFLRTGGIPQLLQPWEKSAA